MSKFIISATTLQRLIKIIEPTTPQEFKTFKIDNNCLIACNKYVACVERIEGDNGVCYINITPQFIKDVDFEANIGGTFTFETLPELAIGTITATSGQNCDNVIVWPDESPLDNWREWFAVSEESSGFMYCDLAQIKALWETSPTGEIVFPEVINAIEPVIVQDVNSVDWVGVFIPAISGKKVLKPATLPEWLHE